MEYIKLKDFLLEVERRKSVYKSDPKNQKIQQYVECIVRSVLHAITKKDERFVFKLIPTGSFYDDAKVGEPDEFDYLAELQDLSIDTSQLVAFETTSEPCFLQIQLKDIRDRKKWGDCLIDRDEIARLNEFSMSHVSSSERKPPSIESENTVLDPSKMQQLFRKMFDEVMPKFKLPDGWEHGGYNRPNFSGVRRHGPATMIMLVYKSATDEYKINVDLTLGIALPVPVDSARINMSVMETMEDCPLKTHITKCLKNGPPLHAIPLYSTKLIYARKFENKISWRISCSGIEKSLFDTYGEHSGPKKFIRIVKALRDKYLTDEMYKTRRKRFEKASDKSGQSKSGNSSGPSASKNNFTPRENEQNKREKAFKFSKREENADFEFNRLLRSNERLRSAFKNITSAFENPQMSQFQFSDISRLSAKPESGEIYGPKTYTSSIEIKTYLLKLLQRHPHVEDWSDDQVTAFVLQFLSDYRGMLDKGETMKHFFFDTFVCTPISAEQRMRALEKFNKLLKDINDIMTGALTYKEIFKKKENLPTKTNGTPQPERVNSSKGPKQPRTLERAFQDGMQLLDLDDVYVPTDRNFADDFVDDVYDPTDLNDCIDFLGDEYDATERNYGDDFFNPFW